MDNEQLLDRLQNLFLGMEERVNTRFDGVDNRLDGVENRLDGVENRLDGVDNRLQSLESKMESVSREFTLNNQLLSPFIHWSHRIENEIIRLSAELQDMQARLRKLENPQ